DDRQSLSFIEVEIDAANGLYRSAVCIEGHVQVLYGKDALVCDGLALFRFYNLAAFAGMVDGIEIRPIFEAGPRQLFSYLLSCHVFTSSSSDRVHPAARLQVR